MTRPLRDHALVFKNRMDQRLLGGAQIIAAGICFGFLGIFGKLAYASGLSVGEVLTYRFSLAGLLLTALVAVFKPKLLRTTREQIIICSGLGVFGYAVFATFYFKAIEGLSASLAALLLYTFPSMVTLGAWLWLKESINRQQQIAVAIAAFGCAALVWGELTVRSWLAFVFGIGSAVTYAIYILASRRLQKEIHPVTSSIFVMLFAAIALAIFHRPSFALAELSTQQMGYIAGLAVICTILPMTLFLSGLQKLKGAEASVLSTIEPIAATILSVFLFGDSIGWGQLIGGLSIIGSVLLTVSSRE